MRIYIIPFLLLAWTVKAQPSNPRIECQKIAFGEFEKNFTTQDEKGEPMILVSAMRIVIHAKRCFDKGFTVNLPIERKKEFNQPGWYCWNPVKKCWIKDAVPVIVNQQYSGRSGFKVVVKCPGVYAFFDHPISTEKGLLIKPPGKSEIVNAQIIQSDPPMIVTLTPKLLGKEIKVPVCDLQYTAIVRLTLKENGKQRETEYLVGAVCDLSESPNAEGYREIRLKTTNEETRAIHP